MSHLTSKFKSTPTITFKSRNSSITPSNQPANLPSPQQYNNNYHDITTKIRNGTKFSQQRRDQRNVSLNSSKSMPGPGTYDSTPSMNQSSFNKKEILTKGEPRFRPTSQVTPAPNEYNSLNRNKKYAPEFSIGKLKRSLYGPGNSNPAPTNYNPLPKNRSASFLFQNSKRKANLQGQKTPGPGQYQNQKPFLSTSFNQKQQILPKSSRCFSSSKLEALPGRTQFLNQPYFNEQLKKQKGFTWKKAFKSPVSATPGPGQYQSNLYESKFKNQGSATMAKTERKLLKADLKRASAIPGPGDHQITSCQMSKFKSTSISKFSKSKLPHFEKPHPSQKQISFINPEKLDSGKKSVPSFSMGHAQRKGPQFRGKFVDQFYDSNLKAVRNAQPNTIISKSQRSKVESKNKMGPTDYETQVDILPKKKVKFPKQKRQTFVDEAVSNKIRTFRDETFESRQSFPNPPKYMNVSSKLKINEKKMTRY